MAIPPKNPITIDGKEMTYFAYLCSMSLGFLKEKNITLNFKGYTETVEEYHELELHEVDKAWKLAKELNAWTEYFGDILNVVRKMYMDADSERTERHSMVSISRDSLSVSNGDRQANVETEVVLAKRKRNTLKALTEELEDKIKFLERAHYHCKSVYELSNRTFSKGVNND